MARRKTLPESVRVKRALAARLAELRAELFGDRGGAESARRLGLPLRTWYNYEMGVTIPATVILKLIELTSVEPIWLLHGRGPKYRKAAPASGIEGALQPVTSASMLLRTALDMLKRRGEPGIGGNEWRDAERENRCIRVAGDAMRPIVADAAHVAFAHAEESPAELDAKLVVALLDGQHIVRWFHHHGRFALLRAQDPTAEPRELVIDLEENRKGLWFRRVVWVFTPH